MCPKDGYLVIENSEVLCGVLGKGTLGGGGKSGIFYRLIKDNSEVN